jgi:hypothetical protein
MHMVAVIREREDIRNALQSTSTDIETRIDGWSLC